jgi:hypothetical protein
VVGAGYVESFVLETGANVDYRQVVQLVTQLIQFDGCNRGVEFSSGKSFIRLQKPGDQKQ